MAKKPIKVTEVVLRDAHQSLLATRMTMDEMRPILPEMDKINYFSVECWGGATFDSCIRFLDEDPWERLRILRKELPHQKLQMLFRGQNMLGYRPYADDAVEYFVQKSVANGIDVIRIFDALNDPRNLQTAIKSANKEGAHVQGCISYTLSPVHNNEYFAKYAKTLEEMGANSICIKDMAGIMGPKEAYDLVSAIKDAAPELPIDLHTHSTTGLAFMTYLKAVEAGVDIIDTAISPFSGGTSQPATETLAYALRQLGYEVDLDDKCTKKIADYFKVVRDDYIKDGTDDRLYAIAQLIRGGIDLVLIYNRTKIDMFFLEKFKNIVEFESVVRAHPMDVETLRDAKRMGFSDKFIGQLWGMSQKEMFLLRREHNIFPVYKMIDTCASEFSSYVPYFYSTYEQENESIVSEREKIVVLGSGPIRIGQGVEFDYSTVHAIWSIRAAGYEAIIINNNPETVSTDYTTSDKLYFEPLTVEDVMNVITLEKPKGIVVSLGGQTAINLAEPLHELGVPIIGTGVEAIRNAEDRGCFEKIMEELGIPQPEAEAVTDIEAGVRAAERIGYPVLVRPSYVLGGRAMQIVSNEERLRHYLQTAVEVNEDSPVLVDRYIMGRELEVDAICDGKDVFIPGIMEHVEKTGIHSGDSISVYPTFSVSQKAKDKIIDYTVRLGRRIGIVGLYNIQFILDGEEDVYVIEVNPRSSRTVPFLSKATGVPMADIATRVILGHSLREQGITEVYGRERSRWFVKAPAFSFAKIRGMESYLSPEMKSTGEAIGYDNKLTRALYKALQSSGMTVANYGTIFLTIADKDKQDALPLVRRFYDLGFNIEATKGTAEFLRQHGIRTRTRRKLSEGSTEIIDSLRQGHVSYVINTIDINQHNTRLDGYEIRRTAVENNVTIFTALETVKVLLDVLEEITLGVSTIDAE